LPIPPRFGTSPIASQASRTEAALRTASGLSTALWGSAFGLRLLRVPLRPAGGKAAWFQGGKAGVANEPAPDRAPVLPGQTRTERLMGTADRTPPRGEGRSRQPRQSLHRCNGHGHGRRPGRPDGRAGAVPRAGRRGRGPRLSRPAPSGSKHGRQGNRALVLHRLHEAAPGDARCEGQLALDTVAQRPAMRRSRDQPLRRPSGSRRRRSPRRA